MLLWRGVYTQSVGQQALALIIDRAKDNYGNDLDTFEQIALVSFGNAPVVSQVLFKPSAGYTMPFNSSYWPGIYWGAGSGSGSTTSNGKVATFPLFPIVGYVANPCLHAVYMSSADVKNGTLVNVVLYGAEHTYLMGYAYTGGSLNGINSPAIGLRWD